MARPEIDDELIDKLAEIIDNVNDVPLPSDELSVNQQFRVVIESLYREYQNAKPSENLYFFKEEEGREWD